RFDLFARSEAISIFGGAEKSAPETPTSPPPVVALPDFALLAEHVAPSVVNISSTQEVKGGPSFGPGGGGPGGGGEGDPFHEFFEPFERFFGPQRRAPYKAKSLGSGFIIEANGHILTNNHVVENADEIVVELATGKEVKGKVVGRGAKTDSARMVIHGGSGLLTVTLGDADTLKDDGWVVGFDSTFDYA